MSSGNKDINDLIVRAGQQDKSAFLALYDALSPKLLGLVMRMGFAKADAEDVLQDAFLRIWTNARRFDPNLSSGKTWAISIVRNRAIDVIREKRAKRVSSQDDISELSDVLSESKTSALGLNEKELVDREALRHCLGTLEPMMRSLVIDAYIGGWSRDELAERHQRPVNTVKTWLQRSLTALKSCMDGS